MNYLMALKEYLRLFLCLKNGTKALDAKFIRCYLKIFLGWATYENLQQNHAHARFVSRAQPCHKHKVSITTNNFPLKKEKPNKAQNVLCNIWLLLLQPGLNLTQTWTLSVQSGLRPCPWAEAWHLGPGLCRPLLCDGPHQLSCHSLSAKFWDFTSDLRLDWTQNE